MAEAKDDVKEEVKQEEQENNNSEELNLGEEETRSAKIKKIIKIAVLCLLTVAGGTSYILIKMSQEAPTIRQLTPITADGKVVNPAAIEKEEAHKVRGKANYYNVSPSFIINVLSRDEKRHYIQFDVSIMTRDSSLFYKLEHHDPIIKSIVLNVASSQSYETLTTLEGREKFREQLLEELKIKLNELTGSNDIDEVLFTKFIME